MTNHDIIIGIDPDVEASGVATLCPKTKRVEATTMTLPALLDYLRRVRNEYPTLTVAVVVEASWTTAHNFHSLPSDSKAVAAKKGYHVGRNHQIGIDIADIARHFSLDVRLQPPLRKIWKGKDRKITHEEICAITGYTAKRSNQEERDAMLLAWTSANLPIKLKL